ncbi:MAG: alpha-galactosidase [Victivallaceae bacterium]|nr:alpha-galactosidase [Victivallaceae bacterium]
MNIASGIVRDFVLEEKSGSLWDFQVERECGETTEVEIFRFKMTAEHPIEPQTFTLRWTLRDTDIHYRWTPDTFFDVYLPPEWAAASESSLALNMPLMYFGATNGENRFLFAVSEAKKSLRFRGGLREEDNCVHCKVEFFIAPDAPMKEYDFALRFDARHLFYAETLAAATFWFEQLPGYAPLDVPPAAREILYSTWYGYHQNVFADVLEKEYRFAAQMGMKTAILDDGWQTEDNHRGYAYCGDWQVAKKRFPDMREHVKNVHALGLKYMVWFSVPFVGKYSANYARFKGKYLVDHGEGKLHAAILDPRFPEVRQFLTDTFAAAVRDWDLDGLKLDFIDNFRFDGPDPAVAENYAGRDIPSLPDAVDHLMTGIVQALRALKPDILIEFRQSYIGPAIRHYGNMLRAGDCPNDLLSNRRRTLELRLVSGKTAIHSDMLEWHYQDRVENAALQLLNVLFCVPQISVRIEDLPLDHRMMLQHYLDFWKQHRDLLLDGALRPYHPELQYPLVTAARQSEFLAAVYAGNQSIEFPKAVKKVYIVNASCEETVLVKLPGKAQIRLLDVCGNETRHFALDGNWQSLAVPLAGMAEIEH